MPNLPTADGRGVGGQKSLKFFQRLKWMTLIEAQWCISRNLTPAGSLENIFYARTCTLYSSAAVKSLIYFLPFLVPESHKGKSNFLALTLAGQTGNKKQQIIVFLLVPTNSFLVRKITHTTLW